jgi:hypothetical protein
MAGDRLIASISAIDIGTLPEDFENDEGGAEDTNEEEKADKDKPLDWTIEVAYADGQTNSFPLSSDSGLYPLINAVPRRAGFLDSSDPTEILFRRFEFPINPAQGAEPGTEPIGLTRISFVFDRSPKGAIIVDDISIISGTEE